jgi:hypothetical protein
MAGKQTSQGREALKVRRRHAGCGTASGIPGLAAVQRPRWVVSLLVLILLPWLRPTRSWNPMTVHANNEISLHDIVVYCFH